MRPSAKVRPAWRGARSATAAERVRPIHFPAAPPAELVAGLDALGGLEGLRPWRPLRFLVAVAGAEKAARQAAALIIGFGDDAAWDSAARALSPVVSRQLERNVDFEAASRGWRVAAGLFPVQALAELLDAWDRASWRLGEEARRRNLFKSHQVRFPDLWRRG